MPCNSPLTIEVTPNAYFDGRFREVACGYCPGCLTRKRLDWTFRLWQEHKHSESSVFATLTYDTDHLEFSKSGKPELRRDHVGTFMKSLKRKMKRNFDLSGIRYYLVGEYGEKSERPHYHALIFNLPHDLIIPGEADWMAMTWGKGNVHFGAVTIQSIAYTAKYMFKQYFRTPKDDDRQPVFANMSSGIGKDYLTPEQIEWHRSHDNPMVINWDYKEQLMPRYYREKIWPSKYEQYQIGEKIKNAVEGADILTRLDEMEQEWRRTQRDRMAWMKQSRWDCKRLTI